MNIHTIAKTTHRQHKFHSTKARGKIRTLPDPVFSGKRRRVCKDDQNPIQNPQPIGKMKEERRAATAIQ